MFKKIGQTAIMGDFSNMILSKEHTISTQHQGDEEGEAYENKVNIEI